MDITRIIKVTTITYCQHCHTCGAELSKVLDGEEWCPNCQQYRRYKSHGWGSSGEGEWNCMYEEAH